MMNTKRKTFNVLSIDGGGIRGIIPAMILKKIEKETERPIHELFDLIAGTSTGGIISLALTMPNPDCMDNPKYSAEDLVNLYKDQGYFIFNRPDWYKNLSLNGCIFPKYPTRGIKTVLKRFFGDTLLSQALTDVLIPSYDMQGTRLYWKDWKECEENSVQRKGGHPRFFKSHQAKKGNLPEENYLMWKVAHATAAAPTFFAPVNAEFTPPDDDKPRENLIETLIDGGIFANNPAMCAYAEAKRMKKEKIKELNEKIEGNELEKNKRKEIESKLEEIEKKDIFIVSLGTGHLTNILDTGMAKIWGKLHWVTPLLKNIIFDGASDTVNYQLKQLLDEKMYYRLQPFLPENCDEMDNVDQNNLKALQEEATSFITNNEDLDNVISQLQGVESQNT